MNRSRSFLLWIVVLVAGQACADLLPVSNDDLDAEVAQAGIAIALDMRLNADAAGSSLCANPVSASQPIPLVECRLAVSLNNRGSAYDSTTNPGGKQEWLVWKGFYGRIFVPYLTLDADSASYTNDGGGVTTVSAVKFGFGGSANKIQIYNWTVTNMAVERDNTGSASGTRGFLATNEDGFLGLRINGNVAISGTLKMFACNTDHPRC